MTVWAFLDESGDPNLAVENGGTTHFTVGAVIVAEPELSERRVAVEQVRHKYFQKGPMRSKTVGPNVKRRIAILDALRETGYRAIGLVVDKRRLRRDSGLRFRQTFMKYLNRFVYERLFRAYPSLRVRADQHGRPEFMESFEAYLVKHWEQTSLFDSAPEIEFVESDSDVLVQAADFVAGSLRIAYGDDTTENDARAILASVRPVSLGIQEWPPAPRTLAVLPTSSRSDDLDRIVRNAAERSAYAFLAELEDDDGDSARMQIEVLQELMHAFHFEDSGHVSGDALVERLRERGYSDFSRDTLRRSVIAPMRDREVLIVSSNKGYGLAAGLADVETYVKRMEDEVRPILRRVQNMDSQLKRVSIGRVDLLSSERFEYLRSMLDRHQELESRTRVAEPTP